MHGKAVVRIVAHPLKFSSDQVAYGENDVNEFFNLIEDKKINIRFCDTCNKLFTRTG